MDVQSRQSASGGFAVIEAAAGEWLSYTTKVASSGTYELRVRYASEFNGGTFHVEVNGQNVTGPISVESSGNWGTFRTTFQRVTIPAGQYKIRLLMDTNSVNPSTGVISSVVCNFDSIIIQAIKNDFNGDGMADAGVFRPSTGTWFIDAPSPLESTATTFGQYGDTPATADFDGDGRSDVAVFRPANGNWYYLKSSDGTFGSFAFGLAGDIPVPGDFNGDGLAELTVYRPSTGVWYRLETEISAFSAVQFGISGDIPVCADYDGDGRQEIGVYRPSNGTWYILFSNLYVKIVRFGSSEDRPAPGDYDGDGAADIALWRPSTGVWHHLMSVTGDYSSTKFGMFGDVPVAGDYDGDGKIDNAVFRPTDGIWYLLRSTLGFTSFHLGSDGDVPIAFLQ